MHVAQETLLCGTGEPPCAQLRVTSGGRASRGMRLAVCPLRGNPGKASKQHLVFPSSFPFVDARVSFPEFNPHSDTSAPLLQFHGAIPLDLIITNSVLAGIPARLASLLSSEFSRTGLLF